MVARIALALTLFAAAPAMAQDVPSYPVPSDAQQRDMRQDFPASAEPLEARVIADCQAATLGPGSCVEVLAWAADESWSDRAARLEYAGRAVVSAERDLAADDRRRAAAYIAMARATKGPTSDRIDCAQPCPAVLAAEPWMRRAIAVLESVKPRHHLALALAYGELAGTLYALDWRDEGDRIADRELTTLMEGLPETYERLLFETENRLYLLQTEQQDYGAADTILQLRIDAIREVSGENAQLVEAMSRLGSNLALLGRYEAAREALAAAQTVYETAALDDSAAKLSFILAQASVEEESGQIRDAISKIETALSIVSIEPELESEREGLRAKLAGLFVKEGEYERAEPLLIELYARNRDDVFIVDMLATNLARLGKFQSAEGLYRDALEAIDNVSGLDAFLVELKRGVLRMGLGRILLWQDNPSKAEEELALGIEEWQSILPDHTAFLDLRFLMAEAKALGGYKSAAIGQLTQASGLMARLFEPSNPQRIATDRRAAILLEEKLGLPPAGWTFYARAVAGAKRRLDDYTSFDAAAQAELRGYRPLFLRHIRAAWTLSEKQGGE